MMLDSKKDILKASDKMFKFLEKNSEEVNPKYDFWNNQVSFICPVCKRVHDEGFDIEGWSERYPNYKKGKNDAIIMLNLNNKKESLVDGDIKLLKELLWEPVVKYVKKSKDIVKDGGSE